MRGIDASPIILSEYARFIASLGEFRQNEKTEPLKILRNPGDLLKHLQFSFLIPGSKELFFQLLELTELSIIFQVDQGIVSGSLEQWKNAIVNCLNSYYSPSKELRQIFDECLLFFDFCGLQAIFFDYRKFGLKDGTFLLEHK